MSPAAEPKVEQVTKNLEETHLEEEEEEQVEGTDTTAAKKKKKNKKKNKKGPKTQTEPPTVPVSKIYTNKVYPLGELHDYVDE